MLDLKVGLFSRSVLGGVNDPNTLSRKLTLLSRLGLIDDRSRSLKLLTSDDVLGLFRVVNFNAADLVICCDGDLRTIIEYINPCNLRKALKSAISVCETAGLVDISADLCRRLNSNFSGGIIAPHLSSDKRPASSGDLPGCQVVEGDWGYSVMTRRSFTRGLPVITLRKDVPISVLSAFRDPRFPGADLFEQGLHPDTIFILFLIFLRERALSLDIKEHAEFFSSQPSSFGTLFELPEVVVQGLDEPELFEAVRRQNAELRSVAQSLQPSPEFSDLLWAKCLCTSRAFSLPIRPESDIEKRVIASYYPDGLLTTLLPGVHYLNHDFAAQLETPVVDAEGNIEVNALVDVEAGSEVFLLYGGFNNKELLLNYGFFVPDNPYDSFEDSAGRVFRRGAMRIETSDVDVSLPEVSFSEYKSLVHGYLRDRAVFHHACSRLAS